MKAVVTSIGEPSTELCIWSLERNGFEVVLYQDSTSLWEKLKRIYFDINEDFVRVDADVIPNRNLAPQIEMYNWWVQFQTYDWFKQDVCWGGVQAIKREALPHLRANVDKFRHFSRPETSLSRIEEFYDPRRFSSTTIVMGLQSFGVQDIERVIRTKTERNQLANYDFELAEKVGDIWYPPLLQ